MQKNQFRRPYRVRRKKSIFKNSFFRLGILILFLAGEIFYLLFFSPLFQIKYIKISNCDKLSPEALKGSIESGLPRKLLFFNTNSIFLADVGEISANMLGDYPQLDKFQTREECRSFGRRRNRD